jgi:O-antigen/teichoic acid export membrane protein
VLPQRAAVQAPLIGRALRDQAKHLTKGVAIYGAGDALIAVVNFFLLGVYVKFDILTSVDYGALALILAVETFMKVVTRWGLDGAFMRFYYDRQDGLERRRMASTIVWFMVAANSVLVAAALLGAGWIAARLSLDAGYITALRLMFLNIGLMAFTFIPLHAMRMRKQAAVYSAFTFARSVGTVLLRVLLVIGLRMGITGMYLTDLILTVLLLAMMWPWCRPLLGWSFSAAELRRALRFGLPRVPAGVASQALDSGPRILLGRHFAASQVGIYQNGTTLGTAVGFFKSAFETAWAPFYYETSRQPDARVVFSKMATYAVAVLVLLVAGTTAVAREVILLVLKPEYLAAVPVVPMIALALGLQGVYQLTSIGLNLTGRTEGYTAATLAAAAAGMACGWWLIPRFGVVGAAATVLISYATQVTIGFGLAQRVYPVVYERGRLIRVAAAGSAAALLARMLPEMPALAGFLARGTTTIAVYAALLWLTGFFRTTERALLLELISRLWRRSPAASPSPVDVA